jgi:tetratricopeptide (TPR) repeat protein
MIEYLDKLIQDKEYGKATEYAERLLLDRDYSPVELLAINCALLTARVHLGEHHGAVMIGEVAVKDARELEQWDRFGMACLDLGFAYHRLQRYSEAIATWYDYLHHLPFLDSALKYETSVRANIALAFNALGDSSNAAKELRLAVVTAQRNGDQRMVHAMRHLLINTLLSMGDFTDIPRLLAQTGYYLRHNGNSDNYGDSLHWHMKFRVDYAILTHRLSRALGLALRGLDMVEGQPIYQFTFHMLLAKISRQFGRARDSLGHLTAARVYAMRSHRYDLESQAIEALYEYTKGQPDAVSELDQYYLADSLSSNEEDFG